MRIPVLPNKNILKMVQESGSKSFINVNTAVSRKDTGYVSDPMAGR